MNIFQKRELIVDSALQVPLFKHEYKAVLFQTAQKAMIAFRPFGKHIIDLGVEQGDGALGQVLGQLFVVIHQNNGYHRAGTDILIPNLIQLCQIRKVDNAKASAFHIFSNQGSTVDTVAVTLQLYIIRMLCLAGRQPLG